MKKLLLLILLFSTRLHAQYAFELKIDYAMRVGNTDQFSVSGSILKGRIEVDKNYFAEDGGDFKVKKIISSKTATTVPVASMGESVSFSIESKNYEPGNGDLLKAVTTRPTFSGNGIRYNADKLPEGELSCRINGVMYHASTVSKPIYIRSAKVLDMFFEAEDKSVIWMQLNEVPEMEDIPFMTKSDTSVKNRMMVCKLAYMPEGYRPTELPNHYKAFEDLKGNTSIRVVFLNKYENRIGIEFSGILRPNAKMLEQKPGAGLFYITEGRVDNLRWDNF